MIACWPVRAVTHIAIPAAIHQLSQQRMFSSKRALPYESWRRHANHLFVLILQLDTLIDAYMMHLCKEMQFDEENLLYLIKHQPSIAQIHESRNKTILYDQTRSSTALAQSTQRAGIEVLCRITSVLLADASMCTCCTKGTGVTVTTYTRHRLPSLSGYIWYRDMLLGLPSHPGILKSRTPRSIL